MAATIVGLEITEHAVRGVEVTTAAKPVLVGIAEVPLPPNAARDSEVLDRPAVALALQQLWTIGKFRTKHAVLAVGGRRLLVREFSAPDLPAATLKQALPFQAQDVLPMPVEQAVLDFYPIARSGEEVHGLLVAVLSELVDGMLDAAKAAKIEIDAVDAAPFGLARVAAAVNGGQGTIAIAHIGAHTTYFVVVADGVPRFVRVLPLDLPTAHELSEQSQLATAGEGGDDFVAGRSRIFDATQSEGAPHTRADGSRSRTNGTLDDLVSRLESTIQFFNSRSGLAPIGRLMLSGSGPLLPGLSTMLAERLPLPASQVRIEDIVTVRNQMPWDELAMNAVAAAGVVLGRGK